MGSLSLWHWLIVLVIVVLVFGTKRLKNVGKDVGEAVKGFKQGMGSEDGNQDRPTGELSDQSQPRAQNDTVSGKQRQDDSVPR